MNWQKGDDCESIIELKCQRNSAGDTLQAFNSGNCIRYGKVVMAKASPLLPVDRQDAPRAVGLLVDLPKRFQTGDYIERYHLDQIRAKVPELCRVRTDRYF